MDASKKYFNRELSWLEFNQRVLDEAFNENLPLLERLKFLAISGGNLDEFFMVRVGSLQILSRENSSITDPVGMNADDQLSAIGNRTRRMIDDQYKCLSQLLDQLCQVGIVRQTPENLPADLLDGLESRFREEFLPSLTPVAVRADASFPLIKSDRIHLLCQLENHPDKTLFSNETKDETDADEARFVLIPIPEIFDRIVSLPGEGFHFLLLEDLIQNRISLLFPNQEVLNVTPFRIARNADMALHEEDISDLLSGMEQILDARTTSNCVRLELSQNVDSNSRAFLQKALEVDDENVFVIDGPMQLKSWMSVAFVRGFEEHKVEPWPPQHSPSFDRSISVFDNIKRGDLLIYHPYHSFDPVVRFIDEAADDPQVLAIKQTLYRASEDSEIVQALIRAAENGKNVTVIVEIKARFDEKNNIVWARHLEQAGAAVIYGVKGLKTHAKISMVTRREEQGIMRYTHLSTGNYNEKTAKIYTDFSLFTSDTDIGADASDFFNAVTGYSQPGRFREISVAPIGLRERIVDLIDFEIAEAKQGNPAFVRAKINSLVDVKMINKLYEASQAGVKVELNVRGICCLRPGVPGLSENIRVVSIVDRLLEHARVVHFFHGGEERAFISSADWMGRNLSRRIELLTPIKDPHCLKSVIEKLDSNLNDNVKARVLMSDGTYQPVETDQSPYRSQLELYNAAIKEVEIAEKNSMTMLHPHYAPSSKIN